jgi:hypothetical protein
MKTLFDYTYVIGKLKSIDGPAYHPKFPISGYTIHKIETQEQYRADKIAYAYYGNPNLVWVIDVANNFYNGFSEYTVGTEIKIPTLKSLVEMGVITADEL